MNKIKILLEGVKGSASVTYIGITIVFVSLLSFILCFEKYSFEVDKLQNTVDLMALSGVKASIQTFDGCEIASKLNTIYNFDFCEVKNFKTRVELSLSTPFGTVKRRATAKPLNC